MLVAAFATSIALEVSILRVRPVHSSGNRPRKHAPNLIIGCQDRTHRVVHKEKRTKVTVKLGKVQ
jgi:hypothetical protein